MKSREKKILIVCGTRPNFMKVSPLIKCLNNSKKLNYYIVHTGQHYDSNMSDVFFSDLNAKKVVYGAPKQMKTVSIEDGVIYELSSLADDGFMEKVHEQIVNSFEFSSEVFVEEETEEPETTTSGEIVLVEESLE